MAVYLNSFYPLCSTKLGRTAIAKHNLPSYIDGSCRREPDFEKKFPAITGLCRPGFAEKLEENDIVIYVTNKRGVGSRKIIAILKVIKMFNDHASAEKHYYNINQELPNNLMVSETQPFPLDMTHQKFGWDIWVKAKTLNEWDNEYLKRSQNSNSKKVAFCKIINNSLLHPIELSEKDWKDISNRKLCAQNPPVLKEQEWEIFKSKINLK